MVKRAIIIETTKEIDRRIDPKDSAPKSTLPIARDEHSSLWWILDSLGQHGISDITYIGNYHIEKILNEFKHLTCRYIVPDRKWLEVSYITENFAPDDQLLLVDATTVLVSRASDILNQTGVGTCRFLEAPQPAGLISLTVREFRKQLSVFSLCIDVKSAGRKLLDSGFQSIDMSQIAAPVSDRQAVVKLVFKGKAQTLENLSTICKNAVVLDIERFSAATWLRNPFPALEAIKRRFAGSKIIVRSSAAAEDGIHASGAGQFLSIGGVDTSSDKAVMQAVDDVVDSYTKDGRAISTDDEVLVQSHISNLQACGVLLTRDIRNGAPYFVLNVDSASGKSDVVTSGSAGNLETYYISWNSARRSQAEFRYQKVLDVAREVMSLTHLDALDIEFGIDDHGQCYLFQARPMAVSAPLQNLNDQDVLSAVTESSNFVAALMPYAGNALGRHTLYSNMADWNPAEMLGSQPRLLDISLYQTLIGDTVWASARSKLNYRDMSSTPLILNICGHPYVDVRASLNSFLPDKLDNVIAEKWIDHCINKLFNDPALHDKLEFEVTATCWLPEYHLSLKTFTEAGLTEEEATRFVASLAELTGSMIAGKTVSTASLLNSPSDLITEIPHSLEDASASALARFSTHVIERCKLYGTEPFSIIARYAFVSMAILKSLLRTGILNDDEYHSALHSIPTVSSNIARDVRSWTDGQLDKQKLVEDYGHLRPQSYNILSPNYRDMPEYFEAAHSECTSAVAENNKSLEHILRLKTKALQPLCMTLGVTVDELTDFIRTSISGREQLKFEFMKSVNLILDLVKRIGTLHGITTDQISHIPIGEILRLSTESTYGEFSSHIRRYSGQNAKLWELSSLIRLPDMIKSSADLFSHRKEDSRPNFITKRAINAPVVVVTEVSQATDLKGKIVLIEAADPGYDWIFGCGISGLATRYGGVASHMSIRAAEFDLPAAIGCGQALFDEMSTAQMVELDCGQERIRCT